MSSFRRYGGLNFSANHNITKSHILNSEKMNVNNCSGRENSKEVSASHIDMSGNSILHTGTIYFQDGTSITSANGVNGATGPKGADGATGATGEKGADGATGATGEKGATGATGSTGEKGATGDSGIVTTVPTVQFGNITSETANIYIPITYPDQTYNGAIPAPVPVIAGCIFKLYVDSVFKHDILDTRYTSINSNGSAFNSNYVRPVSFFNTDQKYPGYTDPGSTTTYTGLQGIVLTNSSTSSSTHSASIQFSDGVTRNAIYYNTGQLTGTNGTISGQYYDYADYSGSNSVSFSWYATGIPPGTAGALWAIQTDKTTYNSIQLTYTPPTQIQDGKDNVPGVNITKFQGTFTTSGDATYRYGGAVGETQQFGENNPYIFGYTGTWQNPQPNNTFSNLYPESTYYFGLYSQNSATTTYSKNVYSPDNDSYDFQGPTTGILQIDTNYSPSSFNINTNFNGQIFATSFFTVTGKYIYKVGTDSGNIQNLFFNNSTTNPYTITTNSFKSFSVSYNQDSRGNSGAEKKLMDITTTITNTPNYDSTIYFRGFPTNSVTISGIGITYSVVNTTDMYTNKLQGYYLISHQFSESFNAPGASNSEYTMNLSQTWYNANNGTSAGNTGASQSFYYDAFTGNPAIGSSSYTNNTTTTTDVSGIRVIATTATFDLSITVTNLYNLFYVSPVLNYVFSGGCTTTNAVVSNLTNYNNPTADTFTLVATASVSDTFNNTQTLNVTANNLNGSTAATTIAATINAIYDKKSNTFINDTNKNPASIQDITAIGSTKFGFRVWSNIDTTPVNSAEYAVIPPPYKYNNTYSYSQFPYNQSWNIVSMTTSITSPLTASIDTSQEIQIYNGHYGTGSTETTTTGLNGYIDYSSYYNNSLNYSEVSRSNTSYRYTTFVWKIIPPSGAINSYQFTFNNISATSISSNLPRSLNGNPSRFFLFYKTEQIDTNVTDNNSSIWIDGNSTYGTINNSGIASIDTNIVPLQNTNYNDPPYNTIVRQASSIVYILNSNNLVATVSAIPINGTVKEHYIYCRFGNSMNYNITYESVTLSLLS